MAAAAAAKAKREEARAAAQTVAEMKKPKNLAESAGFIMGSYVKKKRGTDKTEVYKIIELKEDAAVVELHEGTGDPLSVTYDELLVEWKPYIGKVS